MSAYNTASFFPICSLLTSVFKKPRAHVPGTRCRRISFPRANKNSRTVTYYTTFNMCERDFSIRLPQITFSRSSSKFEHSASPISLCLVVILFKLRNTMFLISRLQRYHGLRIMQSIDTLI